MSQVEAILNERKYRHYAIRINEVAGIGSVLSNSWHNASDCDWVEQDTELDGTCCFYLQHADMESLRSALSYAGCYWPGSQAIALVGSDEIGCVDVPEQGAHCLRAPVVLAGWEQEL